MSRNSDRNRRPAVFFDRDGTLNMDDGFTHKPEDLAWVSGARDLIGLCNELGYYAFVVTNQSGVARGLYPEVMVRLFHERMLLDLSVEGRFIDDLAYCPHHESGVVEEYSKPCLCRKPGTGMLEELVNKWPVEIEDSILVGDRDSDLECARRFGILGVQYSSGNLFDVVAPILNNAKRTE